MKGFIEVHNIPHDRWDEFYPKSIQIAVKHIRTYEEYSYLKEDEKYKAMPRFSYGTTIKLYNAEYKVKEPVWKVKELIDEASK